MSADRYSPSTFRPFIFRIPDDIHKPGLRPVRFRLCSLTGEGGIGSRLIAAGLIGARLIEVRLIGARLIEVRLIDARLIEVRLIDARLIKAALIKSGKAPAASGIANA